MPIPHPLAVALAGALAGALALPLLAFSGAAVAQGTAHPAAHAAPTTPSGPTAAPPDAKLYFIAPLDGARVRGPLVVQFGLRNMGVTQAGSPAPKAGHHHLLVDLNEPLVPGETIPADKNHLHFGGGQTETRLELAPGRHRLQLVLGDANHQPFDPVIASRPIEVVVLPPARKRKRRA